MTYRQLWQSLLSLYDDGEAKSIARLVFERWIGMSFADICIGKDSNLSAGESSEIGKIAARLAQGEPVQYVLGTAEFLKRDFIVRPGVLIPRPETEQIVSLATSYCSEDGLLKRILDIGTGSGCIAVSIKLLLPQAEVHAWDISDIALDTAQENACRLGAEVAFSRQDALHPPPDKEAWDVIVSNPPYVRRSEMTDMHRNVTHYEPEEALFVPDDDPLLFYRAITRYALDALRCGGALLFEINANLATDVAELMRRSGFVGVEIVNDMFSRQRFALAVKQQQCNIERNDKH